jgi:hypothetical protein
MSTYYVNGVTGSDANNGLSRAAAFKNLSAFQAVAANGDTCYVAGRCYKAVGTTQHLFLSSKSNISILQDPEGDQCYLIGGTLVPDVNWTAGAGAFYEATIATGLTINGVSCEWINSQLADGRRYGWMHLEANAAAVNGGGTQGQYFYTSGTGVLRVCSISEAVPTNIVYHISAGGNGIRLDGCSNCVISGIKGGGFPTNSQGHLVRLNDCTACTVVNCEAWDCGGHAFSDESRTTVSAGNTFVNCHSYGLHEGGTHHVSHGSGTNVADASYDGCRIVMSRYLGGDGTTLAGLGNPGQVGIYSHTSGGGTITGLTVRNCTITDAETTGLGSNGNKIISVDNNTTVPANGKTMSQYAVKVYDSTFTIKTRWYQNLTSESYAFERCRFNNTTGSAAGYGNGAGIFHGLGGGKTLYRYCEFNLDMSHGDGSMHGVFYTQASADEFHFYNCTYYDARTNDNLVGILTMNGSAGKYSATGCLWVNAKTTNRNYSRFCWNDATAALSALDFAGGQVFVNITDDTMSQNTSIDLRTDFSSNYGNVTYTDAAASGTLPNIATGSLGLASSSTHWLTRRPSWVATGERGINLRLDNGSYGANQYLVDDTSRAPRGGQDKRAPR